MRKTIQVSLDVKERVQRLRHDEFLIGLGAVSSESDVIDFLIDFYERGESPEVVQAMHLVKQIRETLSN